MHIVLRRRYSEGRLATAARPAAAHGTSAFEWPRDSESGPGLTFRARAIGSSASSETGVYLTTIDTSWK